MLDKIKQTLQGTKVMKIWQTVPDDDISLQAKLLKNKYTNVILATY